MKKRFIDVEAWEDTWFRKLPGRYKNLWRFACDYADNAGVWKVDAEAASFYIGEKVDAAEGFRLFNEGKRRVAFITPDKWLLTGFIRFQYGRLSHDCLAHRGIYETLARHGLVLAPDSCHLELPAEDSETCPPPPSIDPGKAPARPVAASKTSRPTSFTLPEWIPAPLWVLFEDMRNKARKPMTDGARGLIVAKLERFRAEGQDPAEILKNSVEASWQSVYALKPGTFGAFKPAPRVNPAEAFFKGSEKEKRVDAFHREHTKGERCSFCGVGLVKFGTCSCKEYLAAWAEVEK